MRTPKLLSISLLVLLFAANAFGADRKVKTRVQPTYPEMAKNMHISGSVKLEVSIAPDGNVSGVKVLGGHPLLANAAQSAVQKWKYESGTAETATVIIEFHPNE